MTSEQDQQVHHFGGFLGVLLNKIKSKSAEQLQDQQKQKSALSERASSTKELSSVSSTSFEFSQQGKPAVKTNDSSAADVEIPVDQSVQKRRSSGSIPSFVRYAVSSPKDLPSPDTDMSTKLLSLPSPLTQTPSSIASDANMLDQTLLHIRLKLVSSNASYSNTESLSFAYLL